MRWVSPFGYLRINARLTAPRSFSQPSASFFAFCRLGILRIHLKNCHACYLFPRPEPASLAMLPFLHFSKELRQQPSIMRPFRDPSFTTVAFRGGG